MLDEFDRVDRGVDTPIEAERPECFTLQERRAPFRQGFFLSGKATLGLRRAAGSEAGVAEELGVGGRLLGGRFLGGRLLGRRRSGGRGAASA
ncbi:MAG TPA: hypothetical protein RMI62_26340, partial [Polyangiaceae bacterium LLY-WYZ-15_(1-7)]|nr:hypothetical protein [Polyangiaceae bacterium LLY-WYZ-15_(1-7)]